MFILQKLFLTRILDSSIILMTIFLLHKHKTTGHIPHGNRDFVLCTAAFPTPKTVPGTYLYKIYHVLSLGKYLNE